MTCYRVVAQGVREFRPVIVAANPDEAVVKARVIARQLQGEIAIRYVRALHGNGTHPDGRAH